MRIVVLCATRRGYLFVQKLTELVSEDDLIVFSFREEPWEPRFLENIRELTLEKGGQFYETKQVGSKRWKDFWDTTPIDLMFVVSWRYMIPKNIYLRSKLGTYVFHDSLLPKYRGFSPTVWAMVNGEESTGVTLFEIAEGVDEGNIVSQQEVGIGPDDTIAGLMEQVTQAYLSLLEQNLDQLKHGIAKRFPQDHTHATYTCKRIPEDNRIDWANSTDRIYNLIRAVTYPYPGAFTSLEGRRLRIWEAKRLNDSKSYVGSIPGRIVEIRSDEGAVVLTGDGSLLVSKVQLEGDEVAPGDKVLKSLSYTLGR